VCNYYKKKKVTIEYRITIDDNIDVIVDYRINKIEPKQSFLI
jgi:hypothetical protein